jgi:hypothetical protein
MLGVGRTLVISSGYLTYNVRTGRTGLGDGLDACSTVPFQLVTFRIALVAEVGLG